MKNLDYKTVCGKKQYLGKRELYRGTEKEYFDFQNVELGKKKKEWEFFGQLHLYIA